MYSVESSDSSCDVCFETPNPFAFTRFKTGYYRAAVPGYVYDKDSLGYIRTRVIL